MKKVQQNLKKSKYPLVLYFLLSVLLTISYGIHLNRHFYIFGLLARILFRTYEIWTIIKGVLFYWYFLLHFNYNIRQKETSLDSTQSRDRQIDLEAYQQILPESSVPTPEIIRAIRPQIHFLQNSHHSQHSYFYWQHHLYFTEHYQFACVC